MAALTEHDGADRGPRAARSGAAHGPAHPGAPHGPATRPPAAGRSLGEGRESGQMAEGTIPATAPELPVVIQGGMGIGVSGWQLAAAVASAGQLGVVSGVALDTIVVRHLQLGDLDGSVRRGLAAFPVQSVAERILERYFVEGGIEPDRPFAPTPLLRLHQRPDDVALIVAANFVEVFLAKQGHLGPVGVNYLEKVQLATPASILGAMLAGVDNVLMGAGIPTKIPRLLDALAAGDPASIPVDVEDAPEDTSHRTGIDPAPYTGSRAPIGRPKFLAVIATHVLAQFLARNPLTRPDGFVVETPVAGGHSAAPRGRTVLDEHGQPLYSERDVVDCAAMRALGLPFWLAGGYGTPEGLVAARQAGAAGVQVGSAFALCTESGIDPALRQEVLRRALRGELTVRNDPRASSTGFPFKVAALASTLADPQVAANRRRVCDLGYLRVPYAKPGGGVGYRCAGEPVNAFVRKGGQLCETEGRHCLCNGLLATAGLGQRRPRGYLEPPIVTIGQELSFLGELTADGNEYCAADVVSYLLSGT